MDLRDERTRRVHEGVDAVEVTRRVGEELVRRVGVDQVERPRPCALTVGLDAGDDRGRGVGVRVVRDRDVAPARREHQRDRRSQPTTPAGHDGDTGLRTEVFGHRA